MIDKAEADDAHATFLFDLELYRPALESLYKEAYEFHDEFWKTTVLPNPASKTMTIEQAQIGTRRDVNSGIIAIMLNALLQDLASRLGLAGGKHLRAGIDADGEPITRLIWATSNNARHLHQWCQVTTFDPNNREYAPSMLALQPVLRSTLPIHGYTSWPILNLFGGDTYNLLEQRVKDAAREMVMQVT